MRPRYLLTALSVLSVGAIEVGTILAMDTFGRDTLLIAYCVAIAVTLAATGVVIVGVSPLRGDDEDEGGGGGGEPPRDPPPRDDPPRRKPPRRTPPREPFWWGQFEQEFRGYATRPPQREGEPERELTPVA